jgi:8-oxo-dGTP diphosphatase
MVPLRASQLIDAPEGAVRRATRRIELWTRTAAALGVRIDVAARDRAPRGRLTAGDLLSLRHRSVKVRLLLGDRRLILRVVDGPYPGTVPGASVWVPSLRLVAGPLERCDIDLHTATTGAGTLMTITCRAVAKPGLLTPAVRRPVLTAAQTLLGIATLIAREPVVVVAAAIIRDGRVLAARRHAAANGRAQWELPGGKAEPGESDEQAVRREIAEELTIPVRVADRIGPDIELGDNRVLRCFRADPGGEPSSREHAELRWLASSELQSVTWLPADRALLPALETALRGP